ncbi:MAG: hypothetical protein ABH864_03620 [archaeon]
MKTYKNLYPKLCSYKNLELAFEKAKKNKGSNRHIKEFEKNLSQNLLEIKRELEYFTYKPAPLTRFTIQDPKIRTIRKAIFRDRVVHHAIVNILDPIYEIRFIPDSCANRIGRGTSAALKRFDEFKRQVSKNGKEVPNAINNNMVQGYVLKADVKKFFDSVSQKKLVEILERRVRDNRIIWLIRQVLENFCGGGGRRHWNATRQYDLTVFC